MPIGLFTQITITFLSFVRHFWGTVSKPYQTYRELSKAAYPFESIFVFLLVVGYIGMSAILRKGLSAHPLIITLYFGKVFWGIFFTFIFSWGVLYFIGRLFGGKGNVVNLLLPWTYSLIPTVFWFITTSLFYLILPPPRTFSLKGQLFSVIFIALSLALFFWKGVLLYLTLRMGHKLSFVKIVLTLMVVLPIGLVYSIFTYKLGLFRVPFI